MAIYKAASGEMINSNETRSGPGVVISGGGGGGSSSGGGGGGSSTVQTVAGAMTVPFLQDQLRQAGYNGDYNNVGAMVSAFNNAAGGGSPGGGGGGSPAPSGGGAAPAQPSGGGYAQPSGSGGLDSLLQSLLAGNAQQYGLQQGDLQLRRDTLQSQIDQATKTYQLAQNADQRQAALLDLQKATSALEALKFEETKSQFSQTLTLDQAKQAAQEAQFAQSMGLSQSQFEQVKSQFAQTFGLQQQQQAAQESQFGQTFGLQSKEQAAQESQFAQTQAAQESQFARSLGLSQSQLEQVKSAFAQTFGLEQTKQKAQESQFAQTQYSDLAKSLLGTATSLQGPANYASFMQYTGGGKDLMSQIYGNTPRPTFSAPTGQIAPMTLQGLMGQLGLSDAGASGASTPAATGAVPLPHQINPNVWDSLGTTGQQMMLGIAAKQGWDPAEFEKQLNASRPTGSTPSMTSYDYGNQ